MHNVHHSVCGVIPPHILRRVAEAPGGDRARATLEQMRETARARTRPPTETPSIRPAAPPRAHRRVFDGLHRTQLPGRLIITDRIVHSSDAEAMEAWNGAGATYDFFAKVFGRDSIDGRGMRIDSTVHYSRRFDNAMWNGSEIVYGDGDGRTFNRFTSALEVIGHELTHGVTPYTAALAYSGQTGALNEHISDAFGIMVKQYVRGQTVTDSDWLIGAGLFTSRVQGRAIRSMAAPGTAYDDPILGRDPQPSHMDGYVETEDDHGGVHINSGIPNHAFYLAAMAIGGRAWEVTGKIWYAALTRHLGPDADFHDFGRATVDAAAELFGSGGDAQQSVIRAWSEVGLPESFPSTKSEKGESHV
jgi:Zn-dependent metalloprotease